MAQESGSTYKKESFKTLLIKQLLISIGFGLAILIPLITFPTYLLLNNTISTDIEAVEKTSYDAINTHLITGWQKHNIDNVYNDVRQQLPDAILFLQKAPTFLRDGDDQLQPNTETDKHLFSLLKEVEKDEELIIRTDLANKTISAAIPIKFKNECLVCHRAEVATGEAYVGALGGTMVLQVPMSIENISTTSAVIFIVIFLVLFTIVVAYFAINRVQARLLTPLEDLDNRVNRLKVSSHERHIEWDRSHQPILEIDHIDESISEHIETINHIYGKLDALMVTEHETGLFHRDRFNEVMRSEMFRSHRYQHPFSLLVVKVENVKVLNAPAKNKESEEPGSKFMLLGQILHHDTRETDMVFRLDEQIFALIVPETDSEGVNQLKQATHERIINTSFDINGDRTTTMPEYEFSIKLGVATFNGDGDTSSKEILKTAIESMQGSTLQTGYYPAKLNQK